MARHLQKERDKSTRHAAIRKVIRARRVSTQDQLRRLLGAEGILVTQATLSRDLAQMGARRVSQPDGGTHYELDLHEVPAGALRELAELVVSIEANDNMVVVLTRPGAAQAVASAIDRSKIPESLGSLAGDDTIFVTPACKISSRRLCKRLKHLFGIGE